MLFYVGCLLKLYDFYHTYTKQPDITGHSLAAFNVTIYQTLHMSQTMQWRFQLFCLLSSHQNLSHMVGQNPDNTVCAAVVWSFDTFVNNVWASSFHWAGVVSVLIFSVVVDMSRSLWPAYLLLQREVKEAFRRSLLISSFLRSDARTIEGEECARLHTSCESSEQYSVQISATRPLIWFLRAIRFLLCLYCLLMISMSPQQSITRCL